MVEIEEACLGKDAQVVTAVCLAHLSGPQERLYLACHKEAVSRALTVYKKRPAVEQHNRDRKSHFLLKKLHRNRAPRLERMWLIMGLAFYISYGNELVHDTQFADRLGRRSKDGRKDLSWLHLAKMRRAVWPCGCGAVAHCGIIMSPEDI